MVVSHGSPVRWVRCSLGKFTGHHGLGCAALQLRLARLFSQAPTPTAHPRGSISCAATLPGPMLQGSGWPELQAHRSRAWWDAGRTDWRMLDAAGMGTAHAQELPTCTTMSRSNSLDSWKEETGPEGCKHVNDGLVSNTQREPGGHGFAQAQFNPRCLLGAGKLRPGTSHFPQGQACCHHIDPLGATHGSSATVPH